MAKKYYQYSIELCCNSIRKLSSINSFSDRLSDAMSEMEVAKENDTSDEIWQKWLAIKRRYDIINNEISLLKSEGKTVPSISHELEVISENLCELLLEWLLFNTKKDEATDS